MIEELCITAKQVSNELINLSKEDDKKLCTWAELRERVPDSDSAKYSAGYITKQCENPDLEMVIDVLAPYPDRAFIRTWAIRVCTKNQAQYFNNIQLTYSVEYQEAAKLIAKAKDINRTDIRLLLDKEDTCLYAFTISNDASGDGQKLINGERYEHYVKDLSDQPSLSHITQSLKEVAEKLTKS